MAATEDGASATETIPVPVSPGDHTTLTPIRAHYLKKSLIELQFDAEIDGITTSAPNNVSTFSYLGPPFRPPPRDAPRVHLPLLTYIFRQFVLSFPFLAAAPKTFFPDKLQPFMASILSRNLSPTSVVDEGEDDSEEATRMKLRAKMQRNLSLLMQAGTKLAEPEEVVRLSQADLDRLEELARKRQQRGMREKDVFDVNVVCVRTVVDKGRMRSKAHEEFILRTRRSGQKDVFVSRRYGDFKTLADELRKAHPDSIIPPPPGKDRSTVNAPDNAPLSPTLSRTTTAMSQTSFNSDISAERSSPNLQRAKLSREKNRLTLRAYITRLMSSGVIASSPVLRSFLLSGPTKLNAEEIEDSRRREDADKLRDEGRKRFAREIAQRVEGLRAALRDVKGDMMDKDGLTHVFATIKENPTVQGLPPNYQAVLEWARMSLASTVFQHLVAADSASETLAGLKRIHGLMPYFMLKTALRISNPVGMIRTVLDLFMAQPFGSRSLLQRMFSSSLEEEVKALEEDIEAVEDKVDDPMLCQKIRTFVNSPPDVQARYKAEALSNHINVLAVVLRAAEEPYLSRPQMNRIQRAHRAHVQYIRRKAQFNDSDDDDGPQDEDAWLFEDLTVLAKLYSRLRDRQQLIELIFEGTTAEVLKDIITIFYSPLAQVYKAANIADSIGDLQNFVTDLIKTVEQSEEVAQDDPARTVQIFVDLVQRHEQSFYTFVYKVHSKGESLFENLMRWIELFLTIVREGVGTTATEGPLSLEFLLPHSDHERKEIVQEVDAVALYHYKLKLAYEEKLRKRFGRSQAGQSEADAEDEAAQALVNGVVDELSFGELTHGEAEDMAAEETDEESSDDDSYEDSSDYETADEDNSAQPRRRTVSQTSRKSTRPSDPNRASKPSVRKSRSSTFSGSDRYRPAGDAPPVPPLPPNVRPADKALPEIPPQIERPPSMDQPKPRASSVARTVMKSRPRRRRKPEAIKPPQLVHIPKLLPIFVEMITPLLRPRQT